MRSKKSIAPSLALTLVLLCAWPQSRFFSGQERLFCGSSHWSQRKSDASRRLCRHHQAHVQRLAEVPLWVEVSGGPEVEAEKGATVLPVFPTPALVWPDNIVQLAVADPSQYSLYEHLLMTGRRTIIAPIARLPKTAGACTGEDGAPSQCWLQGTAAVLHLDELKDATEKSGGKIKYIAKHTVVGRASIEKVLNPSALFEVDEHQLRTDYLRVQVKLHHDDEDPLQERSSSHAASVSELAGAWDEVGLLAERLGESRHSVSAMESATQHLTPEISTWRLANMWHKLRTCVQSNREQNRIAAAVNTWIQQEKDQGRLHCDPGQTLSAMPRQLLEEVTRVNCPIGLKFDDDFYAPFLRLIAADSASERHALLLDMARDEAKNARARLSIQSLQLE